MKLLFFIREPHPTFRVDVAVLFGKYLPRLNVWSDLVTVLEGPGPYAWGGGRVFGVKASGGRFLRHFKWIWNDFKGLLKISSEYDVVMVRDKPLFALAALLMAKLRGIPFAYWMSFPLPEEWLSFARERGLSIGFMRWLVIYCRGALSHFLLYRIVLPRCEYAFLQSDAMVTDLVSRGVRMSCPVAVPMGVDHEAVLEMDDGIDASAKAWAELMRTRETVVYLGSLEKNRRLEVALHAFDRVRTVRQNALLVLLGDASEPEDVESLKILAKTLGLDQHVLFTGWLDIATAWRLVRAARVGFSPFPRGPVHETASPTKAVEYLALGLPVVANDQPDQAWVIGQSGGGICTTLDAEALSRGMLDLLSQPEEAAQKGAAGRAWVLKNRSYERIAQLVMNALRARRVA